MIVMRLRGRLGNQLFIYAFGRSLQEKYNMPLILVDNVNDTGEAQLKDLNISKDVRIVKYGSGYQYDYYNMKAEDYKNIDSGIKGTIRRELDYEKLVKKGEIPSMSVSQRYLLYRHKLVTRRFDARHRYECELGSKKKLTSKGLFVCENGWIEFDNPEEEIKNYYCFCYFQSEKYFSEISPLIRKEIKRKLPISESLIKFVKTIEDTNSVCLSIRMGDYLNNPVLGVCSKKYYEEAIERIYSLQPDATIFVFSDDVQAVKETLKFKNEVICEPEGGSETEKLTYMSKCKHFIISNSSFSWWAQYLGYYGEKIVIAPSRWTNDPGFPCDIFQNYWIRIDP